MNEETMQTNKHRPYSRKATGKEYRREGSATGITLITLIITIIIMLILVAVVVDVSIDGKLIDSAKTAVTETNDKVAQTQTRVDELMGELNNEESRRTSSGTDENIPIVNSISFENDMITLIKGNSGTLTAIVLPEETSNGLEWESSDTSVVTVADGVINGIENGNATITCKSIANQTVKDTIVVNVVDGTEIYAQGRGYTENGHLAFYEIPEDCKLKVWSGTWQTGSYSSEQKIEGLSATTPSAEIENTGKIEALQNRYYYYQLKDSFQNTSNYYEFGTTLSCFIKGTEVLTEKGLQNIENIKIGDIVYSMNESNNKIEKKKVLQTFKNEIDYKTCKIYLENQEQYIECTTGHQFYTKNKGWTEAYYLENEDILLDNNKKEYKVDKIENVVKNEKLIVYNFEVEGNHNYFVGKNSILVHNPPEVVVCDIDGDIYRGVSIGK